MSTAERLRATADGLQKRIAALRKGAIGDAFEAEVKKHRDYLALVDSVHRGIEVEPDEALAILEAIGGDAQDLVADSETLERRADALVEMHEFRKRPKISDADIFAKVKELDRRKEEHKQELARLDRERMQMISDKSSHSGQFQLIAQALRDAEPRSVVRLRKSIAADLARLPQLAGDTQDELSNRIRRNEIILERVETILKELDTKTSDTK
jgi:hypothetical protein